MQYIEVRPFSLRDIGNFHPQFSVHREIVKGLSEILPVTVAEDKRTGIVIGYIAPRRINTETQAAIFDGRYGCCINLLREYQGKGIGVKLLAEEEQLLREHGVEWAEVSLLHHLKIQSPSYRMIYLLAPAASRLYSDGRGWKPVAESEMDLIERISEARSRMGPGLLELILNQTYGLPLDVIRSVPWNENPSIHQVTITKRKTLV